MGGDYKNPKPKPEKRSFNGGSSISSASMANAIRCVIADARLAYQDLQYTTKYGRAFIHVLSRR
ncbi:putative zinc finger BED domain-containing protein 4-like [Sesbania bispinosa]|nr:putative zinc finger BED domain-containing protein 4-like [Sesbania bispinosa]